MLIARDLARALDPAMLAADAGINLDRWQAEFVRSDAPQSILLVPRQGGKTESAITKALSVCTTEPDELVIAVAPAQRLSDEFLLRAKKTYARIEDAPALTSDAIRRLEFSNQSRLLSLPGDGDGDTIRGLARVRLLLVDEAARCSDGLINAIRPMLATHPRGQIVLMSTPKGKRGIFYETWTNGDPDWNRVTVSLADCPRLTADFLARERKNMGETVFAEEYGLQFMDCDTSTFATSLIDAAFNDQEVLPLWT